MKNIPKEKRDRLVLIVLSTLVVLVALWQGIINLQRKGLETARTRLHQESGNLHNAQRLVSDVDTIRADTKRKSEQLKALEAGMASGDMYSWIIMKVNQFKSGYNVDIPQISREVPKEVEMIPNFPYKAVLFNVRGRACFHDFGRFLADFENAFPFLRVQNLSLEPASGNSAVKLADEDGNPTNADEKLDFRMEIISLANPNAPSIK